MQPICNKFLSFLLLLAVVYVSSCSNGTSGGAKHLKRTELNYMNRPPLPDNTKGSLLGCWWIKSITVNGNKVSPQDYYDSRCAEWQTKAEAYNKKAYNTDKMDKIMQGNLDNCKASLAVFLESSVVVWPNDFAWVFSADPNKNPMVCSVGDKADAGKIVLYHRARLGPDGPGTWGPLGFEYTLRYTLSDEKLVFQNFPLENYYEDIYGIDPHHSNNKYDLLTIELER